MEVSGEIDPIKYGVLWQKVQDMDKKIDKMEDQLEQLVALANRGRGGFWMGMAIMSSITGLIGFATAWFKR
jgi:hypothetical protein